MARTYRNASKGQLEYDTKHTIMVNGNHKIRDGQCWSSRYGGAQCQRYGDVVKKGWGDEGGCWRLYNNKLRRAADKVAIKLAIDDMYHDIESEDREYQQMEEDWLATDHYDDWDDDDYVAGCDCESCSGRNGADWDEHDWHAVDDYGRDLDWLWSGDRWRHPNSGKEKDL